MRLSERLKEPAHLGSLSLPATDALEQAVQRIRDTWPELPRMPGEADREKILRHFALRVQNDRWDDCTMAEAARALRIACLPEFRKPEYGRAVKVLLDELPHRPSSVLVAAATSAYLETWVPGDEFTRALAQRLARLDPGTFPRSARELVQGLPFLFDAMSAHRLLAREMAKTDDPWAALRCLGVPDPHGPGLWAAAQREWLSLCAHRLESQAGVDLLFRWMRPAPDRPCLPAARATDVIAALIGAWGQRMPPEGLVDRITGGLTELYGDPRLRMDAPWGALDRSLLETYHRWLTGANLRLFLDVISEAEERYTREDEKHMWQPRREFWLDLYEKGRIVEAWPAFSPGAGAVAMQRSRGRSLRFDHASQWGRQNLSILLMRVKGARRDWIVVEGSHSYKVHIFDAAAGNAPKLYQNVYDCEAIRLLKKHAAIVHRSNWQFEVRWELDR